MHPSPFSIEWQCPSCRSTYTIDIGECGQDIPAVCRERVRPILVPSADALMRAREAYDSVFDAGGGCADEDDLVEAALRAALDDCDTFSTLLTVARAIVDLHYPRDVFTDAWREDIDPGHKLIVAIRACDEARDRNRTATS
jgi:hypothetical protein